MLYGLVLFASRGSAIAKLLGGLFNGEPWAWGTLGVVVAGGVIWALVKGD